MSTKSIYANILGSVILLIMAMIIFEYTNIDIRVQDHFFNFDTGTWMIDNHNELLRSIFYNGSKKFIVAMGILSVLCLIFSSQKKYLRSKRKELLIFVLALIIVPFLIARAKQVTNMYCPEQIQRYDGVYPYVKLFEHYPEGFHTKHRGKCYPAGHASGGFAMMALFFVCNKRSYKLAGLATGLVMGWIMGLYQMLRGAHYLSHTVVTMLLAWIIICLIHEGVHVLARRKSFAWLADSSTNQLPTWHQHQNQAQ